MSESEVNNKGGRRLVGTVTSAKPNKTITVLIERREKHPLYGKYIRRSTKVHAHDEDNTCQIGDLVTVVETRPLSRTKHFKLVEVLQKAGAVA
jgi:small subunit ribosomal protein S17